MATLVDIQYAATGSIWMGVDDTTPDGHFLVTARILGISTTYLLEGANVDLGAPVVGRVERQGSRPIAYRGGNIKGGTCVSDLLDDAAAFKVILGSRS